MLKLANPSKTMEIIKKNRFVIQKKYGQNFLVDPNILEKIVDAAEITNEDLVVEIGPGIGGLTQYLCEKARLVIAIEIDKKLIPILKETMADYPNFILLNQDVLKTDIKSLVDEHNGGKPIKIVANLPYYITTPIIMDLFEKDVPLISATIMIQKEVGERIQSHPGTKAYGALSLAVQYYSKPEIITDVPPSCFIPRPTVESTVIKLNRYEKPPVDTKDKTLLFKIIRASFNQRRKTLMNGLFNAGIINLSKDEVGEILEGMGLVRNIRGEALTLEQFSKLTNEIYKKENTK